MTSLHDLSALEQAAAVRSGQTSMEQIAIQRWDGAVAQSQQQQQSGPRQGPAASLRAVGGRKVLQR